VNPRTGGSGRSGAGADGGGRKRKNFPECDAQAMQDLAICGRQPNSRVAAACYASMNQRKIWCNAHDGQLGHPYLVAALDMDGNRW
jgi:hypothetical protein